MWLKSAQLVQYSKHTISKQLICLKGMNSLEDKHNIAAEVNGWEEAADGRGVIYVQWGRTWTAAFLF